MQLKPTPFQNDTINDIASKTVRNINQKLNNKIIILKSPTGSGKTFMLSEAIKSISNSFKNLTEISYIWIAPQQLHTQSKNKLEEYFINESYIKCSYFSDLSFNDGIKPNEILFLNWESIINKNKNTIIRENERDFYLDSILEKTRSLDRKIILIIDESHRNVKTNIALSLINNIVKPDITIEASATPSIIAEGMDNIDMISVQVDQVKKDNLIVDQIYLNHGIKNKVEVDENSVKLDGDSFGNIEILRHSVEKREYLEKQYKKEKSNIKPLLLIQVPDRGSRGVNVEQLMEQIKEFLSSKKITVENGKLAIYLSEEKVNLQENDNQPLEKVEVLIFKQAIALGWDCPRSQILVIFRDMKSYTFETQTIGRITRFPDPKKGYFSNTELNKAYIFTNLSSISVKDGFAKSFLHFQTVFRDRKLFDIINLQSWFTKRQRERTRLRSEYKTFFQEESKKYKLKDKLKSKNNKVTGTFFTETAIGSVAELKKGFDSSTKATINDVQDLQYMLDIFASDLLSPEYFPEKRSIKRVVESFYYFLGKELNLDYRNREDYEKILKIILDDRNRKHLLAVTQKAKEKHIKFSEDNFSISLTFIDKWNIPEIMTYSGETDSIQKKYSTKSILKSNKGEMIVPAKLYKTEIEFMKKLEESKKVKWWFKNGEGDGTSFAVKTLKTNGEPAPFFVDFIVFYKNKSIGLYDTKSGITLQTEDIEVKHKGLQDAIKTKHYKKYKLTGGIISNTDTRNHTGQWRLFNGANSKNIRDTSLTKAGWIDFDI